MNSLNVNISNRFSVQGLLQLYTQVYIHFHPLFHPLTLHYTSMISEMRKLEDQVLIRS